MKKLIILSVILTGFAASAMDARYTRRKVEKFFSNYALLGDWHQFQIEQGKLIASAMVTTFTDPRGRKTYYRPEGYFQSFTDWSQVYSTGPDLTKEFVYSGETKVIVRLHGTLTLKQPIHGHWKFTDQEHRWTETFTMSRQGRIVKLDVKMNLGR